MNFEEFLELSEDEMFTHLIDADLSWWEKIQIKRLNKWWVSMRNANPHLSAIDLWESMYKGRF